MLESCGDGSVLAKVAAEPHNLHALVDPSEPLQRLPRTVGASVVDEEELHREHLPVERVVQTLMQVRQALVALVYGNDNGELHLTHGRDHNPPRRGPCAPSPRGGAGAPALASPA